MVSDDRVSQTMDRRDAVRRLVAARGDALIVTGLGSPSYDVHAAGDHDANYYLWGAMGSARAGGSWNRAGPTNRRIMVITGDGEQLMALGALATIAVAKPVNLDIFVLDNEHYGETGMQASHTGQGVDLTAVADACGFADTAMLRNIDDVDPLIQRLDATQATGPRLCVMKINREKPSPFVAIARCRVHQESLRSHLGLTPN